VKRRLAGALALASLFASAVAGADTTDEARADALFQEAKALRGAGRIAEACAEFEESRRLDEGIGVTLYLADCYQQAGELPRALHEFRRAESLAAARGDARAAVAHRRAEALEPLAGGAPRVTSGPPDRPESVPSTQRWLGIGTMATGAVGIGVGAIFGIIALSKLGQSNDGPCAVDDRCNGAGLDLRRQSGQAATASTIGFVAGAAVLGGGVAIYLTAPRAEHEPHEGAMALTPAVVPGGAGLALAGRF
jgi:hypothetical protein